MARQTDRNDLVGLTSGHSLWLTLVEMTDAKKSLTSIVFNNCRAGHAMRNALDMLKTLQG